MGLFEVSNYGMWTAVAMSSFYVLLKLCSDGLDFPKGTAEVYSVLAMPVTLLLSRIIFCLTNIGYFTETLSQPRKMLYFFDGGYAMTGVFIGLFISGVLTAKVLKVSPGTLFDTLALSAGIPLAILRFAESETMLGVGREIISDLLRKVPFFTLLDETDTIRHAVFRYEGITALAIFVIIFSLRHKKWKPGDKALLFITLYGASQVIFESMRDDFHMVWGFIRAQQIYAIFFPVASLIILSLRCKRQRKTLLWVWLMALLGLITGVIKEFDIDTSRNLFLDYGVMTLAVSLLAGAVIILLVQNCRTAHDVNGQ